MPSEADISAQAKAVLRALASRKNVIIAGPPGTGKSRLLNEVREVFAWEEAQGGGAPIGRFPMPPETSPLPEWFPSPTQDAHRKAFQTVFDQNTKYRDFMRGLVPKVDAAGQFQVTSGTLHRAALFARHEGNASLVIVDEINRGPAVAAFGSALVGLEADKRLGDDGKQTRTTQFFEILSDDGLHEEFALPPDLYILAAMNEADTSVEPLDVAFLRRFEIFRLEPDPAVLRAHFGLAAGDDHPLPHAPAVPKDYYEALVRAYETINDKVLLGRGQPYQLGHGALMHARASTDDVGAAQEYLAAAWATLRGHVEEVFYGDSRALADVLCADDPQSPYSVRDASFAGQSVRRVVGPLRLTPSSLYGLLALIGRP